MNAHTPDCPVPTCRILSHPASIAAQTTTSRFVNAQTDHPIKVSCSNPIMAVSGHLTRGAHRGDVLHKKNLKKHKKMCTSCFYIIWEEVSPYTGTRKALPKNKKRYRREINFLPQSAPEKIRACVPTVHTGLQWTSPSGVTLSPPAHARETPGKAAECMSCFASLRCPPSLPCYYFLE